MKTKKIMKCLAGMIVVVVLYLVIAATWAAISVTELLPEETESNTQLLLNKQQLDILLTIEDPRFYSHMGIDISNGQGLTTITSSLAREIFLSGKKLHGIKGIFQSFYSAVFSCCKTLDIGRDVMAVVLNKHLSKEKQLQLFMSSVYMGQLNGKKIIGLPVAANAYFNKNLSDLSEKEFIVLVAMLDAPNYYHPIYGVDHLQSRVSKIRSILSGRCKPQGWFDTNYEHCN